jgi:uncharacterized protein YcaQ
VQLRKARGDIKVQALPVKTTETHKSAPRVTAAAARLLLLGAQGLLSEPSRAATPKSLLDLVTRMGFVQLDSINYVERAHHLTLFSRLDGYRREHFARLLERDRTLFEHWTHDASAVPAEWFAHWKPRFARSGGRIRANRWWAERMGGEPDKVLGAVRERIAREGPLRSQDFEHERGTSQAWWGWKPQKAALELRVNSGDEAVTFEHGQEVVAVPSLGFGHERLEAIVEAEEARGARAVAQDRVEGAEQTRALRGLGQAGQPPLPVGEREGLLRLRARLRGLDDD